MGKPFGSLVHFALNAFQAPQGSRNLKHDATGFLAATKSRIYIQNGVVVCLCPGVISRCHLSWTRMSSSTSFWPLLHQVHGMVASLPGDVSAQLNRLHPRGWDSHLPPPGTVGLGWHNTGLKNLIVKRLHPCSSWTSEIKSTPHLFPKAGEKEIIPNEWSK